MWEMILSFIDLISKLVCTGFFIYFLTKAFKKSNSNLEHILYLLYAILMAVLMK